MGADAVDDDVDGVCGRIGDTLRNPDRACVEFGRDMPAQRIVGRAEALVEVCRHHRLGAGHDLLGGLDDEDEGARPPVAHRGEAAGGADKAGDVGVVAAGVHHRMFGAGAVLLAHGRGVREAGLFLHGKPVHVGAEQDDGARAVAQHAHHAGPADLLGHLHALYCAQLLRHAGSGVHLDEAKFGVAVEMIVQAGEIGRPVGRDRLFDPRAVDCLRGGRRSACQNKPDDKRAHEAAPSCRWALPYRCRNPASSGRPPCQGASSSSGSTGWLAGGFRPRWAQPGPFNTRPRAVRATRPVWMR